MLTNTTLILLGSIINILFTEFGFPSIFGSICSALVVFSGLAGAFVYSIFLMKTKKQRYKLSLFTFASIMMVLFLYFGLRNKI